MKTITQLTDYLESNDYDVILTLQYGVQCAEVESWINGGVDMIIWLNPYTLDEFASYVNDFSVDEQIDIHRQADDYKKVFTVSESVKDFKQYHSKLKKVVRWLNK